MAAPSTSELELTSGASSSLPKREPVQASSGEDLSDKEILRNEISEDGATDKAEEENNDDQRQPEK